VTNVASPAELDGRRADPITSAEERVGTPLNAKWQIDALLGRGGMATVYAATNRATRAQAAVKVLHLEFAQDSDVCDRFVREARIANSIQHAARIAVLDEGMSDRGEIFLVMELLEGTTLDDYRRARAAGAPIEEKLAFFDPVLELLGECHAAGIVHRDIKPANLFLTTSGQIKVLDFGIARLRDGQGASEATKQGTVLGTPAYMAPEQALGLSDLVDGRADLWSVGACIYTLLSGKRVHQARSENEAMVLAATKSADSLATLMPDLPVEVVAFVDKSLAHDRTHRYADARAMRGALAALLAGIRTGQLTAAKRGGGGGDAAVGRTEVERDDEAEASPEVRSRNLDVIKSIWRTLTQFLSANNQYGPTHALALQPMRNALEEIGGALASRPKSLVWDVGPYAFTYAGTPLWDAEKLALERIAFHVFSHGLRKVQFKPGLTEEELRRFLSILTRDRAKPGEHSEDPVAELWAQRFDHIGHLAIDAFASGTAEEIESFEDDVDAVIEKATELSLVSKGWDDAGSDPLEARALQANLLAGLNAASAVASAIALDVPTRMLASQSRLSAERWEERVVDVLLVAMTEGRSGGDASVVEEALREWAGGAVSRGQLGVAFGRFARLRAACAHAARPDAARALEQAVARAMFDGPRLAEALTKIAASTGAAGVDAGAEVGAQEPAPSASQDSNVVVGVERLLELQADADFFESAVLQWLRGHDERISAALFAYLSRWASGREAQLGAIVEKEASPKALAVLALLKDSPRTEAAEAVAKGLRSPHADVRRAALRSLRGEEGQADLQLLLSDPAMDLRCEVLGVLARLRLRAVGPALVRRIQDPSFQSVEPVERKEWLTCLHALNAARAEEIAIEMLAKAPLVPNAANDKNRLLAVEVLATADTVSALAAAKTAARRIWWNSPAVREAAEAAVAAISARRVAKEDRP